MPEKFVIQGGKPLKGIIEIAGAKNAALPILAATLLTKETCVIDNLPLIEDVFKMIDIIKSLGGEVRWLEKKKLRIKCSDINPSRLPLEIIGYLRGSILILGPLLARFGKLKMLPPGGCLIGARPIDTHLDAFSQLGVQIIPRDGFYYFEKTSKMPHFPYQNINVLKKDKKTRKIILRELSVTATENALLFCSNFPGKVMIEIADQDYQVQELCVVLQKMGAGIKGIGTHNLTVFGEKNLKGFNHTILADPIEAGTFIVAALATRGEVLIKNAQLSFLSLFLKRLHDFGAQFKILGPKLIKVLPSLKIRIDKIQSLPYPGIATDLQPELGVLATQSKGPTLIHDPLYEGRLKYLEELNKMGADIVFCDPHRAIINGPTVLRGIEIPTPDLRAGAALVIAGLVAKGKTTIDNVYQIDRGYEKIEERLQKLGADIKRVKE